MEAFRSNNSITEPLIAACLGETNNIFIQRDDLIHPIVSGNKWRKLKYHIAEAKSLNCNHLVTFGGAYSNHMVAVACAAATLGLKSSCFIRGDEISAEANHYLKLAHWYGMQFIPVERNRYRGEKKLLFEQHFSQNNAAYLIDEGGAGPAGEKGVSEILPDVNFVPDLLVHASATGTTAKGLSQGILSRRAWQNTQVKSIAVLKNAEEQNQKLNAQKKSAQVEIVSGFEHGGYAKTSPELMDFVFTFIRQTGILIDPVYTGKALFALREMLRSGKISSDKKILFLHTGGTLGLFSEKFMRD